MAERHFVSQARRWAVNQEDVVTLRVVPATSIDPEGNRWPGVAVFNHHGCRMVMTREQALQFANDIADALQVPNRDGDR